MKTENRVTYEELKIRQALSLEDKIRFSLVMIQEWYETWERVGGVYVSVSGRDSSVLLDLVRSLYPDVPGVFCDTGLEFPEIRSHIKTLRNIAWIKPKISFVEVIEKYGWPMISKEVSQYAFEMRTTNSEKLYYKRKYGANNKRKSGKLANKWQFLADKNCPCKVSAKCCDILKKRPFLKYEKEMGRKAMTGEMASDSSRRYQHYLKSGCNSFDTKRKISRVLGFWTHRDILEYVEKKQLPVAKVYDIEGVEHTGCVFCGFGAQENGKFVLLKRTHPKLWNYCIDTLGMGEVLDYVGIPYQEYLEQLTLNFK